MDEQQKKSHHRKRKKTNIESANTRDGCFHFIRSVVFMEFYHIHNKYLFEKSTKQYGFHSVNET